MPNLSDEVIEDLSIKLKSFLINKFGEANFEYVTSGGSAAIFKVKTPDGIRAYKVFDPKFLTGSSGPAEKKRIEVQRRLIGHECAHLVQIYSIEEAEGTAISEMEFVDWPQLQKVLKKVPDDKVLALIQQLVNVVEFLESQDVVHRDIKPENIHVSENFNSLKLLDLGVARAFEVGEDESASITDQNNTRPFVATAQYSSPEYLFRLDEPSPRLWKGLNLYQVGAVLHDLIQKEPIYQHEMSLGNRWLVTKAVLLKIPVFKDGNPQRLTDLKSLALKCLVKNSETRLSLIDWKDFFPEEKINPLDKLKVMLNKGIGTIYSSNDIDERIQFNRHHYYLSYLDKVRDEMLAICGPKIPLVLTKDFNGVPGLALFEFCISDKTCLYIIIQFRWLDELYASTAELFFSAYISNESLEIPKTISKKIIFTIDITSPNDIVVAETLQQIAKVLTKAIELVTTSHNISALTNLDLLKEDEK